jgi:hypothetical protein
LDSGGAAERTYLVTEENFALPARRRCAPSARTSGGRGDASFCANVASMPLDAGSVFIRPSGRAGTLGSMADEASGCK